MARVSEFTRTLEVRGRELACKRFRLRCLTGVDAGREIIASSEELSIGTDDGNDLVLQDPTVSRHHFSIRATARGHRIADLGSTNGTSVNAVFVEVALLSAGVIIGAGETTLVYELLEEEVCSELSGDAGWGRALGGSPSMRRIFAMLPKIAASEATVLIEGETGTGKSLLAEQIHQSGPRAGGPFLVLDCSAIPPGLVESELFGHERGAFTGATTSRPGIFVAASGGTVFLDEVGELPAEIQPKLLRAIEDRVVRPVGGTASVQLDIRLIAATNRDLRFEVNRGAFRSDLFYRLNTVRLRIPPLRERREDVAQLAAYFWEQFAGEGARIPGDLIARFMQQHWPGNVRELRSAVERTVLFGEAEMDEPITPPGKPSLFSDGSPETADVDAALEAGVSFRNAKERVVSRWEREFLRRLMRRNEGKLSRAARAARLDRNYLRELLRKHEIKLFED